MKVTFTYTPLLQKEKKVTALDLHLQWYICVHLGILKKQKQKTTEDTHI